MKSTEERTQLINQLSESIYHWKHADPLNMLFFNEFIAEEVSQMDIDHDDKLVVTEALEKIFNIVLKYEQRNILADEKQ